MAYDSKRKPRNSMYVPVDDVEVYLADWDTQDLIAELRDRAQRDDKEAQRFLGMTVDEDGQAEPLSSAGQLSRLTENPDPAIVRAVVAGIKPDKARELVTAFRRLGFVDA